MDAVQDAVRRVTFELKERIPLDVPLEDIEGMERVELIPDVELIDEGKHLRLRGHLAFTAEYRAGAGEGDVRPDVLDEAVTPKKARKGHVYYRIPVDIAFGRERVDESGVELIIQDLAYELLSPNRLLIRAVIDLEGVSAEGYVQPVQAEREDVFEATSHWPHPVYTAGEEATPGPFGWIEELPPSGAEPSLENAGDASEPEAFPESPPTSESEAAVAEADRPPESGAAPDASPAPGPAGAPYGDAPEAPKEARSGGGRPEAGRPAGSEPILVPASGGPAGPPDAFGAVGRGPCVEPGHGEAPAVGPAASTTDAAEADSPSGADSPGSLWTRLFGAKEGGRRPLIWHFVRELETLETIAERYGVAPEAIRAANRAANDLRPGMRLLIPDAPGRRR
ncbi:LysM peptidoglycan-binding domain-containing protein [Hydrogenibacillus schlegelii]|uniref:LysM domain-containing protein n=3 Tax=Hydrogenibacillus schlegelii TaxID=1484 RepID=A0A179ITW4_HYDSH|nr:LysM peptidoglycan-binding domain-containing protein [Hydrogenibacillus schlegelii]OAR04924.1 hypothetical protein SA87_04385 [Hydrogenibacillus schlegelii]